MNFFKKHKFLLLILAVASFLRFYKISAYMEFLGDQGRDAIIVSNFLKHGDLMFIGPQTSIGNMYLGPWYYYLMAPALLLSFFNPLGSAIMVALLGVATVWLIWRVGQEWFGRATGLLAAFLLAISPVAVYYSVFSWNPNIMPFFALLSMWLLWRIWQKNEFRKLPWLAISLAMVLNSHYLGLLLFPIVGFFWFLTFKNNRKKKTQKPFLLFTFYCLLIFFFLMFPLVLFDFKHNFANFNAFKQFFMVRQTTVNLKFYKGLLKFPRIIIQLFANLLVKKDQWGAAILLPLFLLAGGIKAKKTSAFWLVVAWLLLGVLGLGNYKQHLYAHYFGFLWPAAVLLLAVSLREFWPLSLPIVICCFWLMLVNWHGRRLPNSQLKRARVTAEAICEKVKERQLSDYNIVNLASYGDFRAMAYRYFLIKECPIKPGGVGHYPSIEHLFVIWEDPEKYPRPLEADVWEIRSGGDWKIKGEFPGYDLEVFELGKS